MHKVEPIPPAPPVIRMFMLTDPRFGRFYSFHDSILAYFLQSVSIVHQAVFFPQAMRHVVFQFDFFRLDECIVVLSLFS